MSFGSTPVFLTAAMTEVINVAAADWAAATVGFWAMTPMTTSATSGATLTTPLLETVTVCSDAVVVGSAPSVGWPLMIGPRMRPTRRLAAAVTAIARPMVIGPMRLVPVLCWVVVFDAWSFMVVSVVAFGPNSAWYTSRTPAAPPWFPLATIDNM